MRTRSGNPVRRAVQHPARIVPIAFLDAITVGTILLALPISRQDHARAK